MAGEIELTCNLYVREGKSDKVYNVSLVEEGAGWVVNILRGRRGNTLITDTKTPNGPVSYAKAFDAFTRITNEKIKKGYRQEVNPNIPVPAYTAPTAQRVQTNLVAMLLSEAEVEDVEHLLQSPEWWLEEKKDGRRMIIEVKTGSLTSVNRYGQTCGIPSAIETEIMELGRDITVDGECVGETLYAFDLLSIDGTSLAKRPYQVRKAMLEKIAAAAEDVCMQTNWQVVETCRDEKSKRKLYKNVLSSGGEGVVFKRATSIYSPGDANSQDNQLKFKFVKTLSAIVTGVNDKRSVRLGLIGEQEDINHLTDVGNVSVPPNQPIPARGDIVEVRYLYGNRGGSLYQPYLIGIRDDVLAENCTMKQVKYKGEADIVERNDPEEDTQEEASSFKM